MYARITGEFESVEFAEFAAKHIRDSVNSPLKISIIHNRNKIQGKLKGDEQENITNGKIFYLLPTAVTSYNYITFAEIRDIDKNQISEPLLNKSVTLSVQTDFSKADKVAGILSSYGGYNIKNYK